MAASWLALCLSIRAASPADEPRWQLHVGYGTYGRAHPVYFALDARTGEPGAGSMRPGPWPQMGPMRAFLVSCP